MVSQSQASVFNPNPDFVVAGLDIGYGNTKFTTCRPGQPMMCSLFPSLAVPVTGEGLSTGGVMHRRNTIRVVVDDVVYEVGKDAELALDVSHSRNLDEAYCTTAAYKALFKGALSYMNHSVIDLLVVGLPILTYPKHQQTVINAFIGEHVCTKIGSPADGFTERLVTVRNVAVLPQPLGAWLDYAISNNLYQAMRDQRTLIVDPGHFTLDWIVSQGLKPIDAYCGSHSGGMSSVIQQVGESLGNELKRKITNLSRIEKAIRDGKNPSIFGQERDIKRHFEVGKEKARQGISSLVHKVGNGHDIDNIILVAGGADWYREPLAEKFVDHQIITPKDPVFSNVRGFYFAGVQQANRMHKQMAKA